jgi:hypothetical protein
MQLVQVLLPIFDNARQPVPVELFQQVRHELTERFGGLTVHSRAPAEGLWKQDEAQTSRDDIVIYEVMTDTLDRAWWSAYRHELESRFRQAWVVVRAQAIELL